MKQVLLRFVVVASCLPCALYGAWLGLRYYVYVTDPPPGTPAYLRQQQARVARAREEAQKAAARWAPGDHEILYGSAMVLVGADFHAAEAALLAALRLKPDFARGRKQLAYWYEGRGRYQDAIEQYETLYRLAPDRQTRYEGRVLQSNVYALWGTSLGAEGRTSEAIAAHRKAVFLDPSAPHHWKSLAEGYERAGRRAQANAARRKEVEVSRLYF